MVRIRVPVATAVAVMALSACGSIHGPYPQPGEAGAATDYVRFPPPPPMPARPVPAADVQGGADVEAELAELNASLRRLASEIEDSRRHLEALRAEVERARARIGEVLDGAGAAKAATPPPPRQPSKAAGLRPLARLRCEQAAFADYAAEVGDAVWTALERLPDAVFDVVAVRPAGDAAQGAPGEDRAWLGAGELLAGLVAMGIEPERLTLSSAVSEAAEADEVHLYIR